MFINNIGSHCHCCIFTLHYYYIIYLYIFVSFAMFYLLNLFICARLQFDN